MADTVSGTHTPYTQTRTQKLAAEAPLSAEWLSALRKAADGGDMLAQFHVAMHRFHGLGCTKDGERAMKWLRKAAENGHVSAQFVLGCLLLEADAVNNEAEAQKWFHAETNRQQAASPRHSARAVFDASLHRQPTAFSWMREASVIGASIGRFLISAYVKDRVLCSANGDRAEQWVRKLAASGNGQALLRLSRCMEKGRGCEKNVGEARVLLERAAEAAEPRAQLLLARKTEDAKRAFEWAKKSAKQGNREAQYLIFQRLVDGVGCIKDEAVVIR